MSFRAFDYLPSASGFDLVLAPDRERAILVFSVQLGERRSKGQARVEGGLQGLLVSVGPSPTGRRATASHTRRRSVPAGNRPNFAGEVLLPPI